MNEEHEPTFPEGNEIEPLNLGHFPELLGMIDLVVNSIDYSLATHPIVIQYPELQKKVNNSLDLLMEVYQAVGAMDPEKEVGNEATN